MYSFTSKNVVTKYTEPKNNLADIFTKYVPNTVLESLRPAIVGREDPPVTSTTEEGKKITEPDGENHTE